MVIAHDAKKAVRIEAAHIVDALFLEIAEHEQDHAIDGFVDELWTLFKSGELRLIDGRVEPVYGEEGHRIAAKKNRPTVEARLAAMAGSQHP